MRAIARVLAATGLLLAAAVRGEVTRTLSAEIPDAARAGFAVENLVGTMRVVVGSGDAVVIGATIHAESQSLADQIRFDRQSGDTGPTISVRYPDDVHTLRYPREDGEAGALFDVFSAGESHDYRGRSYRVSRSHGRLLYVDLEIRVPARITSGRFRNLAGRVEAEGAEGKLSFEVESADLKLHRLTGAVAVRGTSGDIEASEISGDWSSEFTSGDCQLHGFRGGTLAIKTTSGDIDAREISADRIRIRATSGDASVEDADVAELETRSTSGNIDFEERTNRLTRARIQATSGDAHLRLPPDAAFLAEAGFDSGDFHVGYGDAAVTARGERHSTGQRGTGGARIEVETMSGNITIDPR
jgi:hypothetical protein